MLVYSHLLPWATLPRPQEDHFQGHFLQNLLPPPSSPLSSMLLADTLALDLKKERDALKKRGEIFTPVELVPQSGVLELEVGKSFHLKDEGLGREMEVEGSGYCLDCGRGARHGIEDGYGIITNIHGDSKQAFFRVFNGHEGKESMVFVSNKLGKNILRALERVKWEDDEVKFESAFRLGYLNTDQEFLNKGLGRKEVAHVLTTDRHSGREDVRTRIENSGGNVSCHNGVWRVHGSLAISRALADPEEAPNNYLSPPLKFSVAVASDSPVNLHRELIPSAKISNISTAILSPPPKGENFNSSSGPEDHRSTSIYDIPTEAFFKVFNEHGGKKAMVFVSDKLGKNILSALERVKWEDDEVKFESAIRLGYLNTDQEFLNKGLSRKGVAHVLTTDLRPGREDEMIRIENSGGNVSCHNGVWRVHGSLSISRALAGPEEVPNGYLSPPSQFSAAVASEPPVSLHCELIPSARISKMSTAILSPPPKRENFNNSSGSEDHRSTSIYDIPTEVFDKILKLMDKSTICRLFCASRWCSDQVSNPDFCLPQYCQELHRGRPLHRINWTEDGSNIYKNISSMDWTNPPPHHYSIQPFAHPKKKVMAAASKSSCLGLLCLYGPEIACLYNPTTRSVVADLPPFKYSQKFTTLAFGLLNSANQLKVVNLTYCHRSSCRSRCKVLTIPGDLDSGWREAAAPPLYTTHKPLTASVESSIYFLISHRLFRFDLETEQWSEVKLPLPVRSLPMISEFKGNLYLVAKAKIHFEVWLLQEQDVWVKMWALTHNYSGMLMHPVRHDEELERALIVDRHDRLRWYNIDDGTHRGCSGSRLFNIPYVETWASLKTLK